MAPLSDRALHSLKIGDSVAAVERPNGRPSRGLADGTDRDGRVLAGDAWHDAVVFDADEEVRPESLRRSGEGPLLADTGERYISSSVSWRALGDMSERRHSPAVVASQYVRPAAM